MFSSRPDIIHTDGSHLRDDIREFLYKLFYIMLYHIIYHITIISAMLLVVGGAPAREIHFRLPSAMYRVI